MLHIIEIDNLIATIDVNGQQIDGPTEMVMRMESLNAKFSAFNWLVLEMDGNVMEEVVSTLDAANAATGQGKPVVILMRTAMGKGVSVHGRHARVARHSAQ